MLAFLSIIPSEEDRGELEEIYLRHRSYLLRVALRVLNDHGLAEDVLQESFIKLANYMGKNPLPEGNKLDRFLVTIVKHTAIDQYRRRGNLPEILEFSEEFMSSSGASTEDACLGRLAYQRLRELIRRLPPAYGQVMLLRYDTGLSNEEIAQALSLEPTTVRTRIFRAKKLLKDILVKEGLL